MLIHEILNFIIDAIAIISIPLYVRFLWVQLKTSLTSSKDALTNGFTVLLLFFGTYDIYYTLIDLLFVELPQNGFAPDWYLANGDVKSKITMVTTLACAPTHLLVTFTLALNRYTAVKMPLKYKDIWSKRNSLIISISLVMSLVLYHLPVIVFAHFRACYGPEDCYGATGVHYLYVTTYNHWNQAYLMALFVLSIITLVPSIFAYIVVGHYLYTHSSIFHGDSAKMQVLKLTLASLFPSIGTLLVVLLLSSYDLVWRIFQIELLPYETYLVLMRFFLEIQNLSLPWILLFLFLEINQKMFPCCSCIPFWLKPTPSTSLSVPTILFNNPQ